MSINQIRINDNSIYFIDSENIEVAKITADYNSNISVCDGKITNLLNPTEGYDAANKRYVDNRLQHHSTNNKNPHKVNKKHIGLEHVQNIKNNNSANGPPTDGDNLSRGYINGSRWLDITNNIEYLCFSSTLMSAIWLRTNVSDNSFDEITKLVEKNCEHTVDLKNPHKVTKEQLGLHNLSNIKNNYNGGGPPTNADNLSIGYVVGSRWLDLINNVEYLCFSSTKEESTWLYTNLSDNSFNSILGIIEKNTSHTEDKTNPHKVTKDQVGLSNVENTKNNLNSNISPQPYDDIFVGYLVGSVWINKKTLKIYICIDNTLNDAKWQEMTNPPETFGENLGSGEEVYANKLDNKLQFKSIVGGNHVTLESDNKELTVNAKNSHCFSVCHLPIDVMYDIYGTVCYFPWKHSEFNKYINGRIVFHAEIGNKSLSVQLLNKTENSVLGVLPNITSPGFYSFPVANPSGDALLEIQVKKSMVFGTNPRIFGIVLKYDS